jgi:hypothetical protein
MNAAAYAATEKVRDGSLLQIRALQPRRSRRDAGDRRERCGLVMSTRRERGVVHVTLALS